MKRTKIHIQILAIAAGWCVLATSCVKDLLDQPPTTELAENEFWKTEKDAKIAIMGAYADVRPLFDREYYWDGLAEFQRTRGTSASSDLQKGNAYPTGNWNPASPAGGGERYDNMFRYLYGGVNRTNYVIENVKKMLPTVKDSDVPELERIMGEARLLRGMVYFRLISMWGDVQYFTNIVNNENQGEIAKLARLPIAQVKDSIYEDLTYAYEKLPLKSTEQGRASKAAALGFRGKLMLYWGSWKKYGWPEIEGFQANQAEATEAFTKAAADLREVSLGMGLTLWRNGEPGEIDPPGKADILPNYYYLFTPIANENNPEFVMYFTHGGTGTGQGEELMRDVAGRSHEGSQCWVSPRYEIADRYQLISTGDFAPPLIPMKPGAAGARTLPNSALNPQSYAGRDYRMKSSIMWDFELSVGFNSLKSTGFIPFIYNTWNSPNIIVNGIQYANVYNTDGCNTGYVFRKFLRNTAGLGRSEGNYSYPIMRLADVYLMYAEASNEVGGPNAEAVDLVNKIRHRAALPPLAADKFSSKETFFNAIEQERIVELFGEGQRFWDLRRWRALERVWGPPNGPGRDFKDTHGEITAKGVFQNQQERAYQRAYIFRIPPAERERNPNLTQNTPWL
ncbi:RagB/SusD family nutrient uptake outer membrane protein [Chitinophaga sp. GCM10012297]|uniref:RagB/SusD family nutrient uptake outer membrane protein n=1 Tax=Chitinophaga chungangae TaxID=2821488 RepID=A0ABS3YFU9_9BACT|nr:RagB/SusD family nutrient uptake outer membrane protein [Chitinophaga chungangae]MBO9153554.1 RagB/SusD family nutrient uptake outer membrane protein [Chitinophaga chungangae]